MNRYHYDKKSFFDFLPLPFCGFATIFLLYFCSLINPQIIKGSNFAYHSKDTSIIICNNFMEVNELGIAPQYIEGKWNVVSGVVNILKKDTFNTTLDDINTGNSTLVWTSTNALEVITLRISNRKPKANILQTLVNEVKGEVTCLKRITLLSVNSQKTIPSSKGTWITMQQPADNLASLAYLNQVVSQSGDSISTLAYNLNSPGIYNFGWVVSDFNCGADTAKLRIINRRNIAIITTTDAENKPTCGLPVIISTSKIGTSSTGNWKVGTVPIGAQKPLITFESNGASTINNKVLNFSKPGNFELWWVVKSTTSNECPADSQHISIVNIKPLAETAYTSQFIDVCGSTILKAINPALSGPGLTGHWILGKKPLSAPVINTTNLNYNSTVNFPKTGNYYFKWIVKRDLVSCVSDTVEVVFNNIKPSSVSAGLDSTICSSIYELSADQNLEGLSVASKGSWSVYYQPAQNDTVLIENKLSAKTIVRNLNTIGLYKFIWAVTTSSSSISTCLLSDTVFVFNNLHPKFVVAATPSPFCDTLKLLPPAKEYPTSKEQPIESWKIVDNNDLNNEVVIFNDVNKVFRAVGFKKPVIYNFEYSFSFGGCIQKTIISAINMKASAIQLGNPAKEFCQDTIRLSAPLLETGFKGRWESISYPLSSAPTFTDSSKGNTTVKGFIKPGLYKFRWVLYPASSNIQCLRYSDGIVYTNKKASKLPDYYRTDTNFCGPLLKLKAPVLDSSFLMSNSGWNILDAPTSLSKTIKGDTTIFANWGKLNKIKVIWFVSNSTDLSCQRIDTIIRTNQQPMLNNAAGNDIEVCGKNSVASMNSRVNTDMPLSKGTWRLINKPIGALSPVFMGDSTATDLKIKGFSKPGIYKYNWTLKNLNCIERDEVLITNNLPDTIYAKASNPTNCLSFDTIIGINLIGLVPFINAKYSWRIISQPKKTEESEKTVLLDSLLPTCFISGMYDSGLYSVEYSIKNGNCEIKDTVTINRSKIINALVEKREYATCEDSIIIKAIPEESIQGKWKLASGATKEPKALTANNSEALVFGLRTEEDNIFQWIVSRQGCQPSIASVVVKKYKKPPVIKFTVKTIRVCEQDNIILNAISHTPSEGKSAWYYKDTLFSTSDTPMVLLKYGVTSFRYRLTQPNDACESNSDFISVWRDRTFEEPINLVYSKDLCVDTVQLTATKQLSSTYKWTPLSSNPGIISQLPFSNSIIAKNLKNAGVYKIALQISRESCQYLDTAIIIRGKSPSEAIIINNDFRNEATICESEITNKYIYKAAPVTSGKGFWTFNNLTMPEDTTLSKVVNFEIGRKNTIMWTTTGGDICKSSVSQIVNVIAPPPIAIAGKDKIVYAANGYLDATYNSPSGDNKTEWILASTNSTQIIDPTNPNSNYYNLPIGRTPFYWKIDNGICPVEIDTVWITRLESKIPKGFSPNGDFVNNEFVIAGIQDFEMSELSVFNRWGNLVYENKKYNNEWKGESIDGKVLPDDTYYYILKLGKDHEIKNYVVLKR